MADLKRAYRAVKKEERDRLLDELDRETRRWTQSERERIDKSAEFLRKVLKARAGTGKVSTTNIERVSKLTAKSINQLLGLKTVAEEKKTGTNR